MQRITAFALAAACLLAVACPAAGFGQGAWQDARATYVCLHRLLVTCLPPLDVLLLYGSPLLGLWYICCATAAIAAESRLTVLCDHNVQYGLDAWSIHTGSCGFGFICPNRSECLLRLRPSRLL